ANLQGRAGISHRQCSAVSDRPRGGNNLAAVRRIGVIKVNEQRAVQSGVIGHREYAGGYGPAWSDNGSRRSNEISVEAALSSQSLTGVKGQGLVAAPGDIQCGPA